MNLKLIILLLIIIILDNFKQLVDSTGKSYANVSLLKTRNFSEKSNFILPKKYVHKESYDKAKPANILSSNRYQLLKSTLVSEFIKTTDVLCLMGNENELNRNKNVLTSQNTFSSC